MNIHLVYLNPFLICLCEFRKNRSVQVKLNLTGELYLWHLLLGEHFPFRFFFFFFLFSDGDGEYWIGFWVSAFLPASTGLGNEVDTAWLNRLLLNIMVYLHSWTIWTHMLIKTYLHSYVHLVYIYCQYLLISTCVEYI